jgi:hypothetical protein
MATYKIKSEDKAALLNRLEKAGVNVNSGDIKDNKLEGYFEITLHSDEGNQYMRTILKQSPKINRISELLRKIIREEISK